MELVFNIKIITISLTHLLVTVAFYLIIYASQFYTGPPHHHSLALHTILSAKCRDLTPQSHNGFTPPLHTQLRVYRCIFSALRQSPPAFDIAGDDQKSFTTQKQTTMSAISLTDKASVALSSSVRVTCQPASSMSQPSTAACAGLAPRLLPRKLETLRLILVIFALHRTSKNGGA